MKPGLYRSKTDAARWLALPLAFGCAIWVIVAISVWALLRSLLP